MKIACDQFNYKLLKNSNLKLYPIENLGVCDKTFDIVIASWQQICSYLRFIEKRKDTLFIISQLSDASHNRGSAGIIYHHNKNNNSNHILVTVGDGIASWPNHISTPWSRFFFTNIDYLNPYRQKTHWTCLMSKGRPHRDQIAQYFFDNQKIFDMPKDFVYDECKILELKKYMFRDVIPEHNYYKNFPQWERKNTGKGAWTDGDLIFPYSRSRVELVAETVMYYFFVTEKTLKPIRAGIPFVVVSCQYFLKRLHKMGFKTFSPWIDESYDAEPDDLKRIIKCCDAFASFVLNSSSTKYREIAHICNHNQQRLNHIQKFHPNFLNRQVSKIQQIVNHYIQKQNLPADKYTDGS